MAQAEDGVGAPEPSPRPGVKDGHFQRVSAGQRKKSRTKNLLLDTAIAVIAERGIERASIVEIAERAGISNASFYYHFSNKDELLAAVGGAVAATLVAEVDEEIADLESGAERVAMATMLFIRHGVADPAWGGLIVHALADLGAFRDQIVRGIRKDVRIGVEQGQFTVRPSPMLAPMLLAMVGAAMRERLAHPNVKGIEAAAAGALLRALGVAVALSDSIVDAASSRLAKSDATQA